MGCLARISLDGAPSRSISRQSSTGFDPHVLPELWPLVGVVGCAGWARRCASLEVGGGSASWLVGLVALQEGLQFEASVSGKWAEIGASTSPSQCSDPLHRICCLCFVSGVF